MKFYANLEKQTQTKINIWIEIYHSGKLRLGSAVTFLENVGGWCNFLGFVHNDINSW